MTEDYNSFTLLFVAAVLTSLLVELWLAGRQLRHVQARRETVPEAFRQSISLEEHRRAADYTVTNLRVGAIELLYGSMLLIGWTLGGGLDLVDRLWTAANLGMQATGVGVIATVALVMLLLDLPFSLYHTFVVEERFGFNRTTPLMYVGDVLRKILLFILLVGPLAWFALWIMESSGGLWWLYVWALWIGFSLLMMWAYPVLIAPLFNRFTPLQDEGLRQRIQALLQRCGFRSQGIFVMDGSRRSGHGNAYFTGLGRNKRIVFFDTLLGTLEPPEIEAVLAHELGHFRMHHVRKRLLLMSLGTLAALAVLGWLSGQEWFYTGLGVTRPSPYMALMLFMMASPAFTFVLQPFTTWISRRHEFEADDYAVAQTGGADMILALVKLYRENASTLTPDALYSAFHDTHPPAPVRVAHISSNIASRDRS
jgi:STE24 endopeptidase